MLNTVDKEETNDIAKVLKELGEIKDMVKGVQAKQRDIEKNVQRLTTAMDKKEFNLAKSAFQSGMKAKRSVSHYIHEYNILYCRLIISKY